MGGFPFVPESKVNPKVGSRSTKTEPAVGRRTEEHFALAGITSLIKLTLQNMGVSCLFLGDSPGCTSCFKGVLHVMYRVICWLVSFKGPCGSVSLGDPVVGWLRKPQINWPGGHRKLPIVVCSRVEFFEDMACIFRARGTCREKARDNSGTVLTLSRKRQHAEFLTTCERSSTMLHLVAVPVAVALRQLR